MPRLAVILVPVGFALRRMRTRPVAVVIVVAALAAAAGLIGWSGIAAELAQEENVRLRLAEVPRDERSIQAVYHLVPGEADNRASAVNAFFRKFTAVTDAPRRASLWHSVGVDDVRIVIVAQPKQDVEVRRGRLPTSCTARACEALTLAGKFSVGEAIAFGRKTRLRIVGQGMLRPEVLPVDSEALRQTPALTHRALLVPSLEGSIARLAEKTGASVVTTAAITPDAVHASELRLMSARLRSALVRLERSGFAPGEVAPAIETAAPLELLDDLADRGDVARERLLLIAGQGAALIVAFAAFTSATRRRDSVLLDDQMTTIGASRTQIAICRLVESGVPAIVGATVTLASLWIAVRIIGERRGLPSAFATAALPVETIAAIAGVTAAAVVLLFASVQPRRRARFGVGALEVAGLAALGLVAWQASTTGALDPDRIEAGERGGPVLLLLPSLAFFATAVLLLRALPTALHLAERAARRAPFGVRLAFMTAARNPAQAAAATTFLAVALGAALFGLNYRTTLERQSHDEARFAVGAKWRVAETARHDRSPAPSRAPGSDIRPLTIAEEERATGSLDVTPLTRFAAVSGEEPTPVLRLNARVQETPPAGEEIHLEMVGIPSPRVSDVVGWRDNFSEVTRAEIERRLRPRPVRLRGPRVSAHATALRFRASADTSLDRFVVLHFLVPDEQRFVHVRVGNHLLTNDWRTLSLRVPASLRGAEIVGVEFPPVSIPYSAPPDFGSVRFGRFEERRAGDWSAIPSSGGWKASSAGGFTDVLSLAAGPVRRPTNFFLQGTVEPLVHADLPLPQPLPALVSTRVADLAVDGRLTLNVHGKTIPVRVAAESSLFPTVVDEPSAFVVVDYATLFAALNMNQPGAAVPTEAWFFEPQSAQFLERLGESPFRIETVIGLEPLSARLISDPLAAGTREILGLAAAAAAALGFAGLVLAARSMLTSERTLLAEYEALGIRPATLARSMQLRLLALAAFGIAAGFVGGLLAVRLVGALVAVTATATKPLPPIEPIVAWQVNLVLVGLVGVASSVAAAILAGRTLRESAARRLRA